MISAEEFLAGVGAAPPDAGAGQREARPARAGAGRADAATGTDAGRRGGHGAAGPDDPMDFDDCREAALRLLDAAPRPTGALRERLLAKGYDEGVVDGVVDRLVQVRLVDDESYARDAVRYCASRLMGARGALMELTRKGVARDTAARAVRQAEADGVFDEAAWDLGRRYARKTAGLDAPRRRRRFWAAGGRKGHDPQTLNRVARDLFDEAGGGR